MQAQNTILGIGLAESSEWGGILDFNDSIGNIEISAVAVAEMADVFALTFKAPTAISVAETAQNVDILGLDVTEVADALVIGSVIENYTLTTASTVTKDDDYVTTANAVFEMITQFQYASVSQQIDDGYCTKVSPITSVVAGLETITSVRIWNA
jgi:hypothetical protein